MEKRPTQQKQLTPKQGGDEKSMEKTNGESASQDVKLACVRERYGTQILESG